MDCVYQCQALFEEINLVNFLRSRPIHHGGTWVLYRLPDKPIGFLTSRLIHLGLCETPETNLSAVCLNCPATQYIPSYNYTWQCSPVHITICPVCQKI